MKKFLMIVIGILFGIGVVAGEKIKAQDGDMECHRITCVKDDSSLTGNYCYNTADEKESNEFAIYLQSKSNALCGLAINECSQGTCTFMSDIISSGSENNPNSEENLAQYNNTLNFLKTYGDSCKNNFAKCDNADDINIQEKIINKGISTQYDWGLSPSNLLSVLKKAVSSNVSDLCIKKEYSKSSSIIPVVVYNTTGNTTVGEIVSNEGEFGIVVNTALFNYPAIVPRLCPPGTIGGTSSYGKQQFYGCCPAGYSVINEYSAADAAAAAQHWIGCCPTNISGYTLVDFNHKEDSQSECGYLSNSGEKTWFSKQELKNKNWDLLTDADGVHVSGLSISPNFSNTGYQAEKIAYVSRERSGSETVCDIDEKNKLFSCALVNFDQSVIASSELNKSGGAGITCGSCFVAGAPVATTDKNLLVCNADGSLAEVDLINNSVNDTLAWLRTDAENKDLLKTCRERGGIYIFVGCVDPTPLGFITGLIRITLGVVGGVALLQLIWVGILLQSGQEKKIAAARKNLMATLTGVAVLVFSILILRILGVNVLDILPAGSV